MTAVIESDYVVTCLSTMRSSTGSFQYYCTCHFFTDNSLQSTDKNQQEMRAVAEKPHNAVVKFDSIEMYSVITRICLR